MALSKCESMVRDSQEWIKIAAAIDELVRECFLKVLHREEPYNTKTSYNGLPRDGKDLYATLSDSSHKPIIDELVTKNTLKRDQCKLLFPPNKITDSSKFDVTLIVLLIRTFSGLKTLSGTWNEDLTDTTLASLAVRILAIRNRLFHLGSMTTLTKADANKFWTDLIDVAFWLRYPDDISSFKTVALDPIAYQLLYQGLYHLYEELRMDCEVVNNKQTKMKLEQRNLRAEQRNLRADHDRLSQTINENDKVIHELKKNLKRVDKLSEGTQTTVAFDDGDEHVYVSPEVTELFFSMVGKDWNHLADIFKLKAPLICMQDNEGIKWHELKKELQNINRNDIERHVSRVFNLDDGNIHRREYETTDLWYTILSHGSVEISDLNDQSKMKVLRGGDKITYYSNGNSMSTITLDDWDKRCMEYYNRYFSEHYKLIFPPTKSSTFTLDEMAKQMIKSLDSQDGDFYLFTRYDVINHVQMHLGNMKTYNNVLKDLQIASDEELQCSNNRMLLLNPKQKLMLNVRITEDTDIKALNKEESNGRSDLKLLLFLYKRFIKCSDITMANVVLTPNISLDDFNAEYCKSCLIIDRKILNGGRDVFMEWWKRRISSTLNQSDVLKEDDDCLIKIISAVFGFMGTRQIDVNTRYPKFGTGRTYKGDEHNQIINLFFTYDQHRTIDHPALKKMIFGGFGAGKSVLGQYQLKELAKQESNTSNFIFYICWDDNSLLYLQMKKIIHKIKQSSLNQRFYCFNRKDLVQDYLGLSKIPRLSELFQMIRIKCGEDTVHIIIDEFDQENLDVYEADKFDAMFKSEVWKPCFVLFLPQSLEKERKILSGGGQDLKIDNNPYRCIFDLVCFTLQDHMRSTTSNYNFTESAADNIAAELTNHIQHKENQCREILRVKTKQEDVHGHGDDSKTTESALGAVRPPGMKRKLKEESRNEISFQVRVPLDELQSSDAPPNDSCRTETTYWCRKCVTIRHKITGKIPMFIHLKDEAFENVNRTCMLTIAIKRLCMNTECERLFLCKSKDSFLLITNILKLLKEKYISYHPLSGYKFTDQDGNILTELPKYYNLITDNKGARGLECMQAVVFIGRDDAKEQQSFLETTSRCTSELFIVYPHQFSMDDTEHMPPVIHNILKKSIENSVVKECTIKDVLVDDTDVSSRQVEDSEGKVCICINSESGVYKQLCLMMEQLAPIDVSEKSTTVSPFEAPKDLKCNISVASDAILTEIKLTWKDGPYDYIVKEKRRDADNWEYISKPISTATHTFKDLIKGEHYIFAVTTVSSLGESGPAQLPWRYIDLLCVIRDDDLESLKNTINMSPWKVYDKYVNGNTLYHCAAMWNRSNILRYLIHVDNQYTDKRFLDKRNHIKETPLHCASYNGNIECVRILLTHGANCRVKDVKRRTALDRACALVPHNYRMKAEIIGIMRSI